MDFLSDLLLAAAAIGAAAYCGILSRRLRALGALEGGMGSAIAMLSAQVDDLARSLRSAQEAAQRSGTRLDSQSQRAEAAARRLELLVASMHDLDEAADPPRPAAAPPPWPFANGHRTAPPEAEGETVGGGPRARVLRRRQGPGAL